MKLAVKRLTGSGISKREKWNNDPDPVSRKIILKVKADWRD